MSMLKHQPLCRMFVFMMLLSIGSSSGILASQPLFPIEELDCKGCNPNQLDFLYLVKLLQDSHPNVYANFPKEDFEREKVRLLEEFETLYDKGVYALRLQQFCARIGDPHTRIDYGKLLKNEPHMFPAECTILHDAVYLTNVERDVEPKYLGAKIVAVNGIPMLQVRRILGSLASCENNTCRTHKVGTFLQHPIILSFLGIINENESLRLTVTTRDGAKLMLSLSKKTKDSVVWMTDHMKKHPVTAKKRKRFHFQIFPERQLCYFQWSAFFDRQTLKFFVRNMGAEPFQRYFGLDPVSLEQQTDFRQFLREMFGEIRQQHIDYLLIDLRHNRGGKSVLGQQLLYYVQGIPEVFHGFAEGLKLSPLMRQLVPDIFEEELHAYEKFSEQKISTLPFYLEDTGTYKVLPSVKDRLWRRKYFFKDIEAPDSLFYIAPPKTRFSGKVFLLIGPGTSSAASGFATMLSDNHFATLVGHPTNQKPTGFGNALSFRLPYSDVTGVISCNMFYRPDAAKDDEPTLYPDIEVWPTIDDLLNGRDPVFDEVLELIGQGTARLNP